MLTRDTWLRAVFGGGLAAVLVYAALFLLPRPAARTLGWVLVGLVLLIVLYAASRHWLRSRP